MKLDERPKRRMTKLWLPIVLLLGVLLGLLLTAFPPPYVQRIPPGYISYAELIIRIHGVLSTVSAALLVALVVVYVRLYTETRANFALGLVIVLITLLLHSVLEHPFIIAAEGPFLPRPTAFLPPGDILTIIAYSVFLYLSLE